MAKPARTIEVQALVEELQAGCERSFGHARSMPPGVYTSPEFLSLEERDIFQHEWLCVGRASALKTPGDYLTAHIGAQPIVVLRDEQMQLKAMSNVCLHRMSVLLEGRGNVRRIICPYHAWNYSLDGELRGAPLMDRQEGFCKESYRLPAVRCEEWQGWLYVTLDANAPPVHTQLASIPAWQDEAHVEENRRLYRQKFATVVPMLREVLDVEVPAGAFYLWPRVTDDERFTRGLYAEQHVTVLPGSYLARAVDGHNPGQGRVRISLVASVEDCIEAAGRIRRYALRRSP